MRPRKKGRPLSEEEGQRIANEGKRKEEAVQARMKPRTEKGTEAQGKGLRAAPRGTVHEGTGSNLPSAPKGPGTPPSTSSSGVPAAGIGPGQSTAPVNPPEPSSDPIGNAASGSPADEADQAARQELQALTKEELLDRVKKLKKQGHEIDVSDNPNKPTLIARIDAVRKSEKQG